ncbi:MAG: HlyD family efflux transporter periplasmic adaptor subunit [Pseudomonadota bacterium]
MARRQTRTWMMLAVAVALAGALVFAFWPRPTIVDIGKVKRESMLVTIDEEARTRVHDAYVVSAPIGGRLLRVEVLAGDRVKSGRSVIARMLPLNPPALDIRTRQQARAAVTSAEAALRVARADLEKAIAEKDFAEVDLERKRKLSDRGISAKAALDIAERAWRAATATLDVAKATIAMKEADLANARAQLISFVSVAPPPQAGQPSNLGMTEADTTIPLTAPISGRILRVIQESETTVAAGAAILEIGDISNDLEVVAELLSTDAVQVTAGDRVIIRKWGGSDELNGVVERVEPWGFTKTSALGVEEQRVKAIIKFTDQPSRRRNLGHGYRVETQIVIWEAKSALTVPSSALFRHDGQWAVLANVGGVARLRLLKIGRNNGVQAEVLDGIPEGEEVILYPGPSLRDGGGVARRTVN